MRNDTERRWYLTALAAVYVALCSAGCLYYLSLHFRPNPATVPVTQQALCLAFAIAAAAYFVRARVGHIALTILSILTLMTIGMTNPGATAFHLCVLLLLVIPFVWKRNCNSATNNRGEDIVACAPSLHP